MLFYHVPSIHLSLSLGIRFQGAVLFYYSLSELPWLVIHLLFVFIVVFYNNFVKLSKQILVLVWNSVTLIEKIFVIFAALSLPM